MKKNKSIKIYRDENLLNQVVFVDGQAGCGKTMLTAIVSSFKRVEIFNYAPEIENICILEYLNKISKDASETMIKIQTDLCLYETMMSRRVNFRYNDLSSVFSNINSFKYFKRLFQKGDEIIPQRLKIEKPILNYAVHNLLSFSNPIFRALNNKFFIIEVIRHPLYMIIQNTINHRNMSKKNGSARQFRIYLKDKKYHFPHHFYNNEDLYKKLNPCEKAIYDIDFFTKRTTKFKKRLSTSKSKKLLTIPFEQFVLNPDIFIKLILSSLNTSFTSKTAKLLYKQKLPRKKISDGIPLDVYKRFGWSPPVIGFSEKDELNKRRDFALKQKVSKKYLDILDEHSENYEKKYLSNII
jgi:hypothetical protein|tara:strand:- start:8791 stop:9849 length:1059 start_codon:yes stop_codon:yes gene_type:complete